MQSSRRVLLPLLLCLLGARARSQGLNADEKDTIGSHIRTVSSSPMEVSTQQKNNNYTTESVVSASSVGTQPSPEKTLKTSQARQSPDRDSGDRSMHMPSDTTRTSAIRQSTYTDNGDRSLHLPTDKTQTPTVGHSPDRDNRDKSKSMENGDRLMHMPSDKTETSTLRQSTYMDNGDRSLNLPTDKTQTPTVGQSLDRDYSFTDKSKSMDNGDTSRHLPTDKTQTPTTQQSPDRDNVDKSKSIPVAAPSDKTQTPMVGQSTDRDNADKSKSMDNGDTSRQMSTDKTQTRQSPDRDNVDYKSKSIPVAAPSDKTQTPTVRQSGDRDREPPAVAEHPSARRLKTAVAVMVVLLVVLVVALMHFKVSGALRRACCPGVSKTHLSDLSDLKDLSDRSDHSDLKDHSDRSDHSPSSSNEIPQYINLECNILIIPHNGNYFSKPVIDTDSTKGSSISSFKSRTLHSVMNTLKRVYSVVFRAGFTAGETATINTRTSANCPLIRVDKL